MILREQIPITIANLMYFVLAELTIWALNAVAVSREQEIQHFLWSIEVAASNKGVSWNIGELVTLWSSFDRWLRTYIDSIQYIGT